MATPTAAWTTPALMTSLARAGWGELDGRSLAGARRVLRALVDLTDHAAGTGHVTRGQIADTAGGLSLKWTTHCLQILEDLGLITWRRGWLDRGRPRPGFVAISKKTLARMARKARGQLAPRHITRADELRSRIGATLRWSTQTSHQRTVARGELSSPLLLTGSSRRGTQPPPRDHDAPEARCSVCGEHQTRCRAIDKLAPTHDWTPQDRRPLTLPLRR